MRPVRKKSVFFFFSPQNSNKDTPDFRNNPSDFKIGIKTFKNDWKKTADHLALRDCRTIMVVFIAL